MDYIIREFEIRPVHGHQGTKFSGLLSNLNIAEITDMLNTDHEMPRISLAIWYINRVVFYGTSTAENNIIS